MFVTTVSRQRGHCTNFFLLRDRTLVFSGVIVHTAKQEDYHSEMNQHNFMKWVTEKLIPNITEPSIIVMDSAPYHSVIKNKAPTSANKVNEIRIWLQQNNVPFDPDLRKPSLLALVKKHKPEPEYEIDEVLSQYGHTVVRLPPYHCDLNPIELIWALAKRKVASQNVGAKNIKDLTEEAFNLITAQDWKNCCEHVKKIEKEYYDRGRTLYNEVDRLVIQVSADSSDDEIGSESSDESMSDLKTDDMNLSDPMEGVEYLDFSLLD